MRLRASAKGKKHRVAVLLALGAEGIKGVSIGLGVLALSFGLNPMQAWTRRKVPVASLRGLSSVGTASGRSQRLAKV